MQLTEMFRFTVQSGQTFIINDPFQDTIHVNPKMYLFTSLVDQTVTFLCNCHIRPGATVEIFENPTVSFNGILMNQSILLTTIVPYQDIIATDNGLIIHHHVCPTDRTVSADLSFTNGTNYMLKFTPIIDTSKISILS
jgi:hypothetical protein